MTFRRKEELDDGRERERETLLGSETGRSGPLIANLHVARRQMSAQPELPLYASRPTPVFFFYVFHPLPLHARAALLFYSNFISRNNKARETLVAERITSTLDTRPRGDSRLIQREVSGDFDNDRRNENKHHVSSGTRDVW